MFRLCWAALELGWALLRALGSLPRQAAIALGAPVDGHVARPRRLLVALAISLPPCLASSLFLRDVYLVMSPSVDAWAVRSALGQIRKGDLVQFDLFHPVLGPAPLSATKYALCMPGERIEVIERPAPGPIATSVGEYRCNGVLLGVSVPRGPQGQRLKHSRIQGRIPDGFAYVGSRHPRGFDSRYIGLVPIARLRRMHRLL